MGMAPWQRAYQNASQRTDVNINTVQALEPYVVVVIHILNVLGVLLNIVIWR